MSSPQASALQSFVNRFATFAAARIALVLGRWFILILSARHLSTLDFAALAAALSIAEIARAFGDVGVDSFVYSRVGGPLRPLRTTVRTALIARALASALLIGTAATLWLSFGGETRVLPVFILVLASPAQATGVALLQKEAAFHGLLLLVAITFAASITVDFAALISTPALGTMALLLVAPDAIAAISALTLSSNSVRNELKASFHARRGFFKILRPAAGKLIPSAMVAIVAMVYGRLDVLIVRPLFGAPAQADFSAGFRIIEPFFLLFAIASLALLAELGSKAKATTNGLAMRLLSAPPAATVVVIAAAAAFSGIIVHFSTTQWAGLTERACYVAALLATAIPFRVVNTLVITLLQKLGRFDLVLTAAVLNGVLIIAAALVVSASIGFVGVAISTFCGEIVTFAILRWMLKNQMIAARLL